MVENVHTFFILFDNVNVLVHNTEKEKTFQTYTKPPKDPTKHGVYSGRTSGKGTRLQNDRGHHMNETHGPAELDKSSVNESAIRGREQQLIDKHGGAQSEGGTSSNKIRAVSKKNPKSGQYEKAANKEFGSKKPCP